MVWAVIKRRLIFVTNWLTNKRKRKFFTILFNYIELVSALTGFSFIDGPNYVTLEWCILLNIKRDLNKFQLHVSGENCIQKLGFRSF